MEIPRPKRYLIVILVIILVALIGYGGFLYIRHQQVQARRNAEEALTTIADLKAGEIGAWMKERRGDAELARVSVVVQTLLGKARTPAEHDAAVQILDVFRNAYEYGTVAIFDPSGTLRGVTPADGLRAYTNVADEVQTALHSPTVVLADLHHDGSNEPIHLSLLCPVPDSPRSKGPAVGALLLIVDPYKFLYPLVQSWPTPSKTAETILIRQDGDDILYLNELRHRKNTALALRVPLKTPHSTAAMAIQGKVGVFEGVDYRGTPVLAATRPIAGTPWFIVSKMDKEEIDAPVREDALQIGAIVGLVQLVILLGASLIWRQKSLMLIQEELAERERANLSVQQSEARFRTLIEDAPVAIAISRDGKGLFGNRAFLKLLGFETLDEIVGQSIGKSWAPEYRAIIEERAHQRSQGLPVPSEYEGVAQRKDGSQFPAHISVTMVNLPDGLASLAFMTDLSERKRAEEELRARDQRLRAMFNHQIVGVVITSPEKAWIEVNDTWCRMIGYSRDELPGLDWSKVTHPDDLPADLDKYNRLLAGEFDQYLSPKRYIRKDGSIIYCAISVGCVRRPDGAPEYILALVTDTTESKKAEEERSRLATAIEQACETIMITDTQATILYVNPAFEKTSGYTCQEAIGMNARMLKSGQHEAAFYKQMWETLDRGEVWHGHLLNKRKDGTLYKEDTTISPIRDAAGQVINFIALKLDITRESELEEQLRQAQKVEAVGQLAGGVAHDFNNLLSAIIGFSELTLSKMESNHPFYEHISQVIKAGERAATLTRQLLIFSRKQIVEPKVIDVNSLVGDLHKMLRRLVREDIDIVLALSSSVGCVKADPGQLEQVITNLVVNARDAMPQGGVLTIATGGVTLARGDSRSQPDTAPGEYILLSIKDTGIGMTDAVKRRIFEPFFTTKPVGQGTGLGLATCYGAIKQCGGQINVETEVGRGTTFSIYLPRVECAAPAEEAAGSRPTLPRGTETILLVEDDEVVRQLAEVILSELGYQVLLATDGMDGLRIAGEHGTRIQLLLTDVVMPQMNGKILADTLQAKYPQIKVIFMSGYSADTITHDGIMEPGLALLQKPFSSFALAQKVREILDS